MTMASSPRPRPQGCAPPRRHSRRSPSGSGPSWRTATRRCCSSRSPSGATNRMDLSLWPADAGVASSVGAFNRVLADSNAQLLADDTPAVVALLDELRSGGGATIGLVVDNAGFKRCTDFLLADHLLSSRAATCPSVTLALAARPRSYPFSRSHTDHQQNPPSTPPPAFSRGAMSSTAR